MDLLTSLLIITSMAWIFIAVLIIPISRARKSSNLPPEPYHLPIIGNILSLGSNPHRSLSELSRKYGPVMSLKLGRITTVVVSTPETARIVLQKHDSSCSSRAVPSTAESLSHNELSVVWLPVGTQWRKLRKICREQMFSVARLDASQSLRREKLQKLHDYVRECSEKGRAVNIGDAAFATSLNLISSSLFSMEFAQFDSNSSQEMKEVVWGVMRSNGRPNFADFFPMLKPVDPQGLLKETRFYFGKLFAIFDGIIQERMKGRGEKNDLVEALIDLNQRDDEDEFTIQDIKHLLLDLFVAGTDTTAGTVEWAMAELVRNPTKMSKLKNEVTNFTKENGELQEPDFPSLPYLQAVVKETFRLHPVVPLLLPHRAKCNVEIKGYVIPENAQILINVWASGRDPNIWTNPDEFIPERFLNQNVDFRGQDFELIPFGAGRRICPGLPLAYRMVHQMLATFVTNFEWKIENMQPEEIDMKEKFGITLQKAVALKAVPIKA